MVEVSSPFDDAIRLEVRRIDVGTERTLVLARDVTQLNRLLTMRQEFIANVSHELRTPLTVIVGYLESMLDDGVTPDLLSELASRLETPTLRMQSLVEDLLLLTRLESSPLPGAGELMPVDVSALVGSVFQEMESLASPKHQLVRTIESESSLIGIEVELYSALANLVGNAIKFSPEGGPVEVRWSVDEKSGCLTVADQGLGYLARHCPD